MSKPKDVAGVQRFIGMVKYLAKFLPRLSEVCEPLRNLTHKDAPWVWGKDHAMTSLLLTYKKQFVRHQF
eukprot:gene15412-6652_t